MDTETKQIVLSVLGGLREDLTRAHLNNGSRLLDLAGFRQYLDEQIARIRTTPLAMDGRYCNDEGHRKIAARGMVTTGKRMHKHNLAKAIRKTA